MKEEIREIKAIEDKYGLWIFRMALIHLADVGVRNFDGKSAAEWIIRIQAEGENDKAKGITCVMSPDFQCEIIRCATELSGFSIMTLFAYIKEHVTAS